MFIKNIYLNMKKYSFLLKQLVARDFKVKYKRSVLGVVWSLLYPVFMMLVLYMVFSHIFVWRVEGVNFLVYLLSGLVIFNYFSEATNLAMSSIVSSGALINKVYLPKYIFPLSKCLFVGINFLLTLIPLYVVILLTGTGLNLYHFLIPYTFVFLFMFTLGMGLFLATVSVFLRDMFYIYGIIIMTWTYLTPIMYDISMIDARFQFFFRLNPMYHFISFAREIILHNRIPGLITFVVCAASGLVMLAVGMFVFKKNQDKFIYHL